MTMTKRDDTSMAEQNAEIRRWAEENGLLLGSSRFVIVICLLHGGVPIFVARPAPRSLFVTRGRATASSILVQLWLALDITHPLTHRGAEGSRP